MNIIEWQNTGKVITYVSESQHIIINQLRFKGHQGHSIEGQIVLAIEVGLQSFANIISSQ